MAVINEWDAAVPVKYTNGVVITTRIDAPNATAARTSSIYDELIKGAKRIVIFAAEHSGAGFGGNASLDLELSYDGTNFSTDSVQLVGAETFAEIQAFAVDLSDYPAAAYRFCLTTVGDESALAFNIWIAMGPGEDNVSKFSSQL